MPSRPRALASCAPALTHGVSRLELPDKPDVELPSRARRRAAAPAAPLGRGGLVSLRLRRLPLGGVAVLSPPGRAGYQCFSPARLA